MGKASFVLVSVIACMLGACQGVSVAKSPMRMLGSMNRYYVDTWDDSAEIKNTEDGISQQTILTGGTQKVVVLIHGRGDSAGGEFAVRLREAFLNEDTSRTTAVIRVEWGAVTNLGYAFAVSAVPFVVEDLVEFLTALGAGTESNLNLENLHIVGFDLGAHVAGQTSRIVGARKVTGLDPAGESWGQYTDRLRGTDAEYVEVIHTDGVGVRAFGVGENLGGLNFFPNGGTRQPGCANSNNLCHHNRAWELYAATLEYPGGHLRGLRCDDLAQMSSNRCSGPPAIMGTSVLDKRETGIYRLVTGRVPPY